MVRTRTTNENSMKVACESRAPVGKRLGTVSKPGAEPLCVHCLQGRHRTNIKITSNLSSLRKNTTLKTLNVGLWTKGSSSSSSVFSEISLKCLVHYHPTTGKGEGTENYFHVLLPSHRNSVVLSA